MIPTCSVMVVLTPDPISDHHPGSTGAFWVACLQAVADIVRTTLGPRAMLKMLLDASGGESLLGLLLDALCLSGAIISSTHFSAFQGSF